MKRYGMYCRNTTTTDMTHINGPIILTAGQANPKPKTLNPKPWPIMHKEFGSGASAYNGSPALASTLLHVALALQPNPWSPMLRQVRV